MEPASCPFRIKVVFERIVQYVGTDHASLLACRQVSHGWNEMALEVLRQKGTLLGVGSAGDPFAWHEPDTLRGSMQRLFDFCEGEGSKCATAFDHLQLHVHANSHQTEIANEILHAIRTKPELIINAITYHSESPPALDTKMMELIRACADTLKEFRCIAQASTEEAPSSSATAANAFEGCTFPNLVKIWVSCPYRQTRSGLRPKLRKLEPFALHMANIAPKLCSFRYESTSNLPEYRKATGFGKVLPPGYKIHELELPMERLDHLTPDSFPGFQNMQVLKLVPRVELVDLLTGRYPGVISDFLSRHTHSHLSLNFDWSFPQGFDDEDAPQFRQPVTLPTMPALVHLGISAVDKVALGQNSAWFMAMFLKTAAEQCQGLESFSIDLRIIPQLISATIPNSDGDQVPWWGLVSFPNVQILAFTSTVFCGFEEEESGAAAMISALFPKLDEISFDFGANLDDMSLYTFGHHYFSEILKFHGIRCLKFKTYYKNWMLNPLVQGSAVGQSLECLELGLPKCFKRPSYGSQPDLIRVPDLGTILEHFPELKVLHVQSGLVIDKDGGSDFSIILEELRQIRKVFANIDINVL